MSQKVWNYGKKSEKNQKKISLLIISLFLLIYALYFLYSATSNLSKIGRTTEFSQTIVYNNLEQTIYIKSKIWGLTGDHSRLFFSNENRAFPDENTDIIFHEFEIYYKQQGLDSLYIYIPSNAKNEVTYKQIGKVKVCIYTLVPSELKKYKGDYKRLGLSRINAYDGIE